MRNWSMVRTGSTSAQKSLFFNMKRVQAKLEREAAAEGLVLDQHQLREKVAQEIGVRVAEVEMMEGRLAGSDASLNATQAADEDGREWIDALEDDGPQAAERVEFSHDTERLRGWLVAAMRGLSARERHIVAERRLRDEPRTLESLGRGVGAVERAHPAVGGGGLWQAAPRAGGTIAGSAGFALKSGPALGR